MRSAQFRLLFKLASESEASLRMINYICEAHYVISFAVSIVRTTNSNEAVLDQRYFMAVGG